MDTSDSSPPNISISPSEVQFLKDLLDGEVQRYRALVELANLSESAQKNDEVANAVPLVERLNEYPINGVNPQNLVTYPPKLEPVPVKPLFFDAAWNYIEYPGRKVAEVVDNGAKATTTTAAKSADQTVQQKKGWFGFGR
jgi:signal recognition particle subunit SRP68